jgi:hypothetical protein
LKNDRNVLKFNVKADNPYIIHYYLADDTIDIREVIFPNSDVVYSYTNNGRFSSDSELPRLFIVPDGIALKDYTTVSLEFNIIKYATIDA